MEDRNKASDQEEGGITDGPILDCGLVNACFFSDILIKMYAFIDYSLIKMLLLTKI